MAAKTYGKWLVEQRGEGVTQGSVIAACEPGLAITQPSYSRWEHGESIPSIAQAVAVHAALGVSSLEDAIGMALLAAEDRRRRLDGKTVKDDAPTEAM